MAKYPLALAHRGRDEMRNRAIAESCYEQAKKMFDMKMWPEAARYFAYAEIYESHAIQQALKRGKE